VAKVLGVNVAAAEDGGGFEAAYVAEDGRPRVSLAALVGYGWRVFGLLVVHATKDLGLSAHSSLIGLFDTAAALGGLASAASACWLGRRFNPIRATLFAQTAN
jgi:hypothetical protein